MVKNILMIGVGGQGIVLASNIVCSALLESGFDVKKSEIHGMAQRGGSVVSHVRFGDKIHSPVISEKSADLIVSFEYMEFLRYMNYVHDNSILILNTRRILPPSTAIGQTIYPDKAVEKYRAKFKHVIDVDADKLATQVGNIKSSSIVMIGKICKVLEGDQKIWETVITENVPQKTKDINIKAFRSVLL